MQFQKTQQLYSVRNTPGSLTLKVRCVPCLCPPCIADSGECLNAGCTDPWKVVQLIPEKGANLWKYQKHKHHYAQVCETEAHQNNPKCSENRPNDNNNDNNNEDLDSDGEQPEISIDFEVEDIKKKKRTKEMPKTNSKTVTDHVTDVTDQSNN